jgi:hypothetical protein
MPRERVRAEARLRWTRDGHNSGRVEGKIPAAVRDHLGAGDGGVLVFEEGSTFVAERAAARGAYFVVYLDRSAPAPMPSAPEPEPAGECVASAEPSDAPVPFAEVVGKKLSERGRA